MPTSAPTGIGLALRAPVLPDLISGEADDALSFVEVVVEDFMERGGHALYGLDRIAERLPVLTHGLSLSLGGTDPLNDTYLEALSGFLQRYQPAWHSDHLGFCSQGGVSFHERLPVPFKRHVAHRIAQRTRQVTARLQRPVAVKNITWHVRLGQPELDEPAFIREVLNEADAKLVLDLNSAYINAKNLGEDVGKWLARLPLQRIVEIHVAGHEVHESGFLVDTHGTDVCDEVYELLAWVVERVGPVPVVLARERQIPPFPTLVAEVRRLDSLYQSALHRWRTAQAETAVSAHD